MKLMLDDTDCAPTELWVTHAQARWLWKNTRLHSDLYRALVPLIKPAETPTPSLSRRAPHTQDIITLLGSAPAYINKQKKTRSYKWRGDEKLAARFTRAIKKAKRADLYVVFRAEYQPTYSPIRTPSSVTVYRSEG